MTWLQKLMPSRIRTQGGGKRGVPEGLWIKCESCAAVLYQPELERNLKVCPKCGFHLPIGARERLRQFLDENTGEEIGALLEPVDALKFRDSKRYRDRIVAAQKQTGEKDALVALRGELKGRPLVACAFEFSYMGGSMGSVVGERFGHIRFGSRTDLYLPAGARLLVAPGQRMIGGESVIADFKSNESQRQGEIRS